MPWLQQCFPVGGVGLSALAAANTVGRVGALFRFTIGRSIGMILLLCAFAYLPAGWLSWMLP